MTDFSDDPVVEEVSDSESEMAGSSSHPIFEEFSDSEDEDEEARSRYFGRPTTGPRPVTYDESIFQRIRNGERRLPDNANLRGAPLSDLNLDGIVLIGVNFEGSDLSRTTMRNAILKRACFTSTKLQETDFTGATLTGADFKHNLFLTKTKFNKAKLGTDRSLLRPGRRLRTITTTKFDEAELEDVDFSKSDLTSTSFVKAKLVRVKFDDATLNSTTFSRSLLILCLFVDIEKTNAFFRNACIEDCRFARIIFDQATFEDASLLLGRDREMIFDKCEFTKTDFTHADLRGVYLKNCYLPAPTEEKEKEDYVSGRTLALSNTPLPLFLTALFSGPIGGIMLAGAAVASAGSLVSLYHDTEERETSKSINCIRTGLETLRSAQNVYFVNVKGIVPWVKSKLKRLGATFLSTKEAKERKIDEKIRRIRISTDYEASHEQD